MSNLPNFRLVPPVARLLVFLSLCSIGLAQVNIVGGVWCGNVTPTSATVAVRLNTPGQRVRLQVSEDEQLARPLFSAAVNSGANNGGTAKLTIQGLEPDTQYYYGLEIAGVLRTEPVSRGRFRTFPTGPASFRIAFGSCGDFREADQSAFSAIMNERPLMFIHMGDLHYSDTNSAVAEEYRRNYDNVLGHHVQGPLFRSLPIAYIWDDHDYSGNNSDMNSVGQDAARQVYRERVPHYPITATGGTVGQAFTVGRVRFIMTDLRSASTPANQREAPNKTRMGAGQKTWFKQELINARDGGFPMIVWVCPDPWIAPAQLGDDTWGGHATERTELANFIRDNRINNLVLLSGDMHALAFDDGTNSDYATGGGAPVIVLHAAALTSGGSTKGGPYFEGPYPGSQQYGILEVYDQGGSSVACRFLGMKANIGPKITRIFSRSMAGAGNHALVNISSLASIASATDTVLSGFVVSATPKANVLVRAVGPALAGFGVKEPLAAPVLSVFQGDRLIATNSAWAAAGAQQMNDAFDRVGAFRLNDPASRDTALVLQLAPGPYTVEVKNGGSSPGQVLLEVYDLP